jgi:hypothetical protein
VTSRSRTRLELATASLTWRAGSPACVTRIGPNKASRAANKASNGKPFVYDELVARMRAVLRRSSGPRHPRLTVRDLEIDLASRVVTSAARRCNSRPRNTSFSSRSQKIPWLVSAV